MMDMEVTLRDGAQALGVVLTEAQVQQLLAYQALLAKWNKVYNLTSVRDPAAMLTHHVLDSLAVVPHLLKHLNQQGLTLSADLAQAPRLLDVGSGGGLPGVVLAIVLPGLVVHCVDTVGKKAHFIAQVATELRLPNLKGIHARVEQLKEAPYQVVTSRAFASLSDFVTWSAASLAPGGVWMALKGKHPADELAALPAGVEMFHVEPLSVPGLDAERCVLWLRPNPSH